MMSTRRSLATDLAWVFVTAFGVRLLWALLTPPWASPDEPDHFTYVSHLMEEGEIPRVKSGADEWPVYSEEVRQSYNIFHISTISGMGSQAGGYLQHLPVQYDYLAARTHKGTEAQRYSAAGARATPYPPLYYAFVGMFYRLAFESPLLTRLYAVRSGSAFLGALTCCFAYLMAFQLRRERAWGRAVGLAMAFMPMHAFVTATVNNDAAMVLFATALSWLSVCALVQPTLTPALALAMGVTSGLTLISKPTGAPIVFATAFLVLCRTFPFARMFRSFVPARAFALAAFVGALGLIEGSWVTFRALTATATSLTRSAESTVLATVQPGRYSLLAYFEQYYSPNFDHLHWLMIQAYWGIFGWLEVLMPATAYDAVLLIYVVGGIGLIARLVHRPLDRKILSWYGFLLVAHTLSILVLVDYGLSFAHSGQPMGMQGRYFFPSLGSLLVLLVSGVSYLLGDTPGILRLLPLSMFVLQLVALSTMLSFYYGIVLG